MTRQSTIETINDPYLPEDRYGIAARASEITAALLDVSGLDLQHVPPERDFTGQHVIADLVARGNLTAWKLTGVDGYRADEPPTLSRNIVSRALFTSKSPIQPLERLIVTGDVNQVDGSPVFEVCYAERSPQTANQRADGVPGDLQQALFYIHPASIADDGHKYASMLGLLARQFRLPAREVESLEALFGSSDSVVPQWLLHIAPLLNYGDDEESAYSQSNRLVNELRSLREKIEGTDESIDEELPRPYEPDPFSIEFSRHLMTDEQLLAGSSDARVSADDFTDRLRANFIQDRDVLLRHFMDHVVLDDTLQSIRGDLSPVVRAEDEMQKAQELYPELSREELDGLYRIAHRALFRQFCDDLTPVPVAADDQPFVDQIRYMADDNQLQLNNISKANNGNSLRNPPLEFVHESFVRSVIYTSEEFLPLSFGSDRNGYDITGFVAALDTKWLLSVVPSVVRGPNGDRYAWMNVIPLSGNAAASIRENIGLVRKKFNEKES